LIPLSIVIDLDPNLFKLGPFLITWHGVFAVLGILAAARLGRRYFGRGAGLLGGLLLAGCGVAAFLDVSLYSEGLLLFLATVALAVVGREGASWRRAAAAGALVGAAAIVRPTALVLLPIFAWTFFRRTGRDGGDKKRGLGLAAVTFAAAAAFVAPVTAANLRATGAPLLVQGHGGFNFFIGNSPFRDGLPSVRPGGEWDRLEGEAVRHGALSAADQDRYFVRKTLAEIAASRLSYARLLAMKVLWTIQADEVRDPFSFAFFRQEAPILRFLPGFGVLFPLASVGALAAARSRPRPALLFAAAGAWLATDVLLVTSFRYRAPVLPILAVFAANGVVLLARRMRAGWRDLLPNARRERLLLIGALVAAAVATGVVEALAAAADGFSGAEIEAAVKGALLDAFMDGVRQLTTDDVLHRVGSVRPTSQVKHEQIAELRRWAQEHLAIDAARGQPTGSGERLLEL
jgi:hypothetical protein